MKRIIALLLIVCLVFVVGNITAGESVIILDNPDLKAYVDTEYQLEGSVPLGSKVVVNDVNAEMFRRFESSVPLNPAPSYTTFEIEVFGEDETIIETQTLHIENYKKTEIVFTLDEKEILVNSEKISIGIPAQKSGTYIYIPFEDVCKILFGAGSSWDEETKTETFSGGGYDVEIPFDSEYFYVNGEKKKFFQHRPIKIEGKTFVPHWLPGDAFDCRVWHRYNTDDIEITKEYHPKKDFEEPESSPESMISFDRLDRSIQNKSEIKLKGNIPDKTFLRIDGKDLEITQKFRTTVKVLEGKTETPIKIEAFDPDGKLIEKRDVTINSSDKLYAILWLGKHEIQVGRKLVPLDVPPQIIKDRTMVPLRAIANVFEAEIFWVAATKTVKIKQGSVEISLPIGSKIAVIDGHDLQLDVPAQIIDNRTLVPIRFIADAFDAEIRWNPADRAIEICK